MGTYVEKLFCIFVPTPNKNMFSTKFYYIFFPLKENVT